MIEALLGGAVDFTGSVTNAVNATIQAVGLGSTVTVANSIFGRIGNQQFRHHRRPASGLNVPHRGHAHK